MDQNLKLSEHEGSLLPDPTIYRRLVGRLMYLTLTRPDIVFAVHKLSQFMEQHREPHYKATQHILQYIKGAPSQGMFYPSKLELHIKAFSDSDWVGCPDTRRSTTGPVLYLLGKFLSVMEIKEANYYIKIFCWGRIQGHGISNVWSYLTKIFTSWSWNTSYKCNLIILRQSSCNLYSSQSSVSWKNKTHRNWLPFGKGKNTRRNHSKPSCTKQTSNCRHHD